MAFTNKTDLESRLTGLQLTGFQCYNVNDYYTVIDPEKLAIIDGGIVLDFNSVRLAIGWSIQQELFDVTFEPISSLFDGLAYYEIPTDNFSLAKVVGKTITTIEPKWNWYQLLDDNLDPTGPECFFLEGLVLNFENGITLQIASVNYTIENKIPVSLKYDCQGELLISIDDVFEIGEIV